MMSIDQYFDDPVLKRQMDGYLSETRGHRWKDPQLAGTYTLDEISEFLLDDLYSLHSLSHIARFEDGRLVAPCGTVWTATAIRKALDGSNQ